MLGPWSLNAYLAASFTAVSILLTIILTAIIGQATSAQVRRGIGANLAELAHQTTSRLDRSLFERYREVGLLAHRLQAEPAGNRVAAELDAVQSSYKYYAWIGVTDAAGRVRMASGNLLVGQDVSQRPWFIQAMKGAYLGDVHEAVLLAKLLPKTAEGEPQRFYDVAYPLVGVAGVTGVLGAHISWDWAKDVRAVIFNPSGNESGFEPLIVAGDGTVLLGPGNTERQTLALESIRRAQAGETGSVIETWPDGKAYLVGFSKTRGYENAPTLGWTVLVRQHLTEAYAPVRALQWRVGAAGLAIALLFSVLGWWIARAIARPLQALTASARTISSGDAPLYAGPAAPYPELGELTSALNSLVTRLQAKQDQLAQLNAELEERVEQRTAQLRDALGEARASEQRVHSIIEAAQDPFFAIDLDGRVTDWNTRAQSVFGWPRQEILGRMLSETLIPERFREVFDQSLQAYLRTGQTDLVGRPIERLLTTRDGREIPVEIQIGFAGAQGRPFFSVFARDITQRKEVERLKDEFISTVSHELRTPLTSIYGSLSLLDSGLGGELPPDAKELVHLSTVSTQRLVRLINDILDVEKIATGKLAYNMQRQPLAALVRQALRETQAYADEHRVRIELAPVDDVQVMADADRIVQVCVNLVSNAVKFSPAGQAVKVSVEDIGPVARVSVVDRGPGVPPQFRERMFERFAQADGSDRRAQGGTGLGLNISRSIVAAHGGRIDYTSEPQVRTEFFFELPAA